VSTLGTVVAVLAVAGVVALLLIPAADYLAPASSARFQDRMVTCAGVSFAAAVGALLLVGALVLL
jgi:hypothetical protein